MDIPALYELSFEEKRHAYTLNGIEIPSVTTVMKPLSESYYGSIDKGTLDNAASRGTIVHQAIENYLLFDITDIPPEHAGYLDAFVSWWGKASPQLVGTESRVYHKALRYAGTVDLSCVIEGVFTCIDIKTSSQVAEMLTRVQLEAYSRAFASHGVNYEQKTVLHLKKDGSHKTIDYKTDVEAFEVFGSLLTVHNYIQKHSRAK